MSSPRVSVIMATYNHASFVEEAIESVLLQEGVDFELLIADDGSPDSTRDVIESIRDSRIRYFPNTVNRGACIVTNELVSNSRGEFIALINSDDAWIPGKLKYQLDFLDANPDVHAMFGRARYIDRDGSDIAKETLPFGRIFDQENRSPGMWLRRFFAEGNCLCHPTIMVRSAVYSEIGPFDNRLRQLPDYDMWIRLAKRHAIHVSDRDLIRFRVLPGESASSYTRANAVRTINEHCLIADNFFDGVSKERMVEGFGDILVYKDPPTAMHLEVEKTMMYFHDNPWLWRPYKTIGLLKMRKLLSDPRFLEILAADYGIGDRWFHEQMARIDALCPPPADAVKPSVWTRAWAKLRSLSP